MSDESKGYVIWKREGGGYEAILKHHPTDDSTQMDAEALGLDFKDLGRDFGNDRVKQAEKEFMDAIETHLEAAKHDPINHPSHYTSSPAKCICGERIECIQIVEHMPFCEGNAVKYLWRCGLKDGVSKLDDLRKAEFYIRRAIEKEIEEQNGK